MPEDIGDRAAPCFVPQIAKRTHVIVYRPREEVISVIRILHQRMSLRIAEDRGAYTG